MNSTTAIGTARSDCPTIVICLLVLLSLAGVAAAQDLVANGGFEAEGGACASTAVGARSSRTRTAQG